MALHVKIYLLNSLWLLERVFDFFMLVLALSRIDSNRVFGLKFRERDWFDLKSWIVWLSIR